MRIIAGKLKGTVLYLPPDKNTRPLKDRAKESIFNLLVHSNKISFQFKNSNILDLYAGTGSFGLECLSREANNVYFVEQSKSTINILKKNINKLKVNNKANILHSDVIELIKKKFIFKSKFDLIFCDPPFKSMDIELLIDKIFHNNILKKNGTLIIHRNKNTKEILPNFFEIIDERNFGISKIIFGKFSIR